MNESQQQPAWRRFQSPRNLGRGFEKFFAAIQKLEASGAQVVWNERINGRQFDVTVRVAVGEAIELTIFECRDHSKKPVGATDVEAFVTKASDAGANKAALVAPVRFTKGAARVAAKHGMELWTLKEILEDWPTRLVEEQRTALNIRNVELWSPTGERYTVPGPETTVLPDTIVEDSTGLRLSFSEGFQRLIPKIAAGPHRRLYFRLRGFSIYFPGEPARRLEIVSLEAGLIPITIARRQGPPVNVPQRRRYEYSRAGGQETRSFGEAAIPVGFDTIPTPGRFYRNTMGLRYKCLGINGDRVRMILLHPERLLGDIAAIESIGSLNQTSAQYVEIEDPEECRTLEEFFTKIPVARDSQSAA